MSCLCASGSVESVSSRSRPFKVKLHGKKVALLNVFPFCGLTTYIQFAIDMTILNFLVQF